MTVDWIKAYSMARQVRDYPGAHNSNEILLAHALLVMMNDVPRAQAEILKILGPRPKSLRKCHDGDLGVARARGYIGGGDRVQVVSLLINVYEQDGFIPATVRIPKTPLTG